MRIPSYQQRIGERENLSMTPMIDVVFLLLIFFVCAATGQLRELLLPTDLNPGDVAAEADPNQPPPPLGEVWIRLHRRGAETEVDVNGALYNDAASLRQVLTQLAAVAAEMPVILDVADEVPLGDVVEVYDACRAANFDTVLFATDPV